MLRASVAARCSAAVRRCIPSHAAGALAAPARASRIALRRTTMTLARRPFLVLAALGALAAPLLADAADVVRGSGVAASQRRDVGAFGGVALGGPFAVVLRPAAREAVEVTANDNLMPLIETTVRGSGSERTLHIEVAKNARIEASTKVVVTVDVVRLDRVAVGGSGSIDGKAIRSKKLDAAIGGSGSIGFVELDVDELAVAIGGSGTFRADGRAKKLAVNVAGSGKSETENLAAADVTVAVAGSGDARVRADNALSASIAGSGDVYHTGAATPRIAIVGSGRVKRI
jgi:hypothetical protein